MQCGSVRFGCCTVQCVVHSSTTRSVHSCIPISEIRVLPTKYLATFDDTPISRVGDGADKVAKSMFEVGTYVITCCVFLSIFGMVMKTEIIHNVRLATLVGPQPASARTSAALQCPVSNSLTPGPRKAIYGPASTDLDNLRTAVRRHIHRISSL